MKIDINLLFRFFEDKHSSAEADALGEWLSADEKHQEAFSEAFRLFQAEEVLLEEKKAKGFCPRVCMLEGRRMSFMAQQLEKA